MKSNSATLGFLPYEALEDYHHRGGLLGAKTADNKLIGYLLYSIHHSYFRIAHLCVCEEYRGEKIAKRLIQHLRNKATTQSLVKLRCRRDYAANAMRPALGFIPIDEKPGRSSAGHHLTLWCLTLAQNQQLELFQALTLNENLNAVIDAQVFFDFYEPKSDKAIPSKSLLSDFLVDALNLWTTDELLVEIDRQRDPHQRQESRKQAHAFPRINHDPVSADNYEAILRKQLPTNTRSQVSDIRHLAKTAASASKIFVTRDHNILKRSNDIRDLIDVRVLSPTALIVGFYEFSNERLSKYHRISGLNLSWRPFAARDLEQFPVSTFVEPGQRHGPFTERLHTFLSRPDRHECSLLELEGNVVAFRILTFTDHNCIICHLVGVARMADQALIGHFVASDTIARAIATNMEKIQVHLDASSLRLLPALHDIGFLKYHDAFVRLTFPRTLERRVVLDRASLAIPEIRESLQNMPDVELERQFSPLIIPGARPTFMVPIRPGYAMSLFDSKGAGDDLFGGRTNVLIRLQNVYYRKANHVHLMKAPGRIFWYVSSPQSRVVAVSLLDEVRTDEPKVLFREFHDFGVLDWKGIFEMCDGDITARIMALRFSNSFVFGKPICLSDLRDIFSGFDKTPVLQSPSKISNDISRAMFDIAYGDA